MPNDARIEELAKGAHIPCGSTQDCLAKIEEALRTAIREAREEQAVWMIERKANGPIPAMWWTGGAAFGVQRDCWTVDPQHGVKFSAAIDATTAHIALMTLSGIRTENMREKHLERVTITEHLFLTAQLPTKKG